MAGLGGVKQIDTSRRILVAVAIEDLDLVADVGGRTLGVESRADRILPARSVANGHAAIAARRRPPLQVQIELPVIVFGGVQPGLVFGLLRNPLTEQRAVPHDGPDAVADRFPAVEASVEQLDASAEQLGGRADEWKGQNESGGRQPGILHRPKSIKLLVA